MEKEFQQKIDQNKEDLSELTESVLKQKTIAKKEFDQSKDQVLEQLLKRVFHVEPNLERNVLIVNKVH